MKTPIQHGDQKDALLYLITDEDFIHASWIQPNGTILVFEHIPSNYPALTYIIWPTKKEYVKSIKGVDWIRENIHTAIVDSLLFWDLILPV